jgi:RNA methyltransferase, TrmH family
MTDERRNPPALSSPANPRIRAAAALRDRRERESTGLTIVDGARELRRALAADVEVVEAFVCEPLLAGEDARAALDGLERLASAGVAVHRTTEAAFAKLAFGERAEGLVAVIRPRSLALEDLHLPDDPLVVVIEGVEKPGNVGAILRSADGAGAAAVIAASPRTDLTNPNVIRASAGTVFSVPLASGDSEAVLARLRARSIRPFAARVGDGRAYTEADLRGAVALVLGAEDRGLTSIWTAGDIEAIHLPMSGVADSLNVSVTAAVLLYEARRQRDRHRGGAD